MKISNTARSAMCDALVDLVDAGSPPGHILFFTGSAPTNTTDGDSGTLLATLTFTSTAFGGASSGVATAAAITSGTVQSPGGTAGYFRIKNAAGTVIAQGTVAKTSGGDINFDENVWLTGGTAAMSSLTITQPAGT